MLKVGADDYKEGLGCGSADVHPITAAHSIFKWLMASLHFEGFRSPSYLNLGSTSGDRVSSLKDSRFVSSLSVTRCLSITLKCMI